MGLSEPKGVGGRSISKRLCRQVMQDVAMFEHDGPETMLERECVVVCGGLPTFERVGRHVLRCVRGATGGL